MTKNGHRRKHNKGWNSGPNCRNSTGATLTRVPRSADVMDPICFNPRRATTLSGFWTGLYSKYQHVLIYGVPLLHASCQKILSHADVGLNPDARAWLVACGCGLRIDNEG